MFRMGDRDSNLVEKEVVLILMMFVQTKQKTIDIEKHKLIFKRCF